jgi:uncharacterized protein YcfL
MKIIFASTLTLLLISGCSSLPSYQEMSCKDLINKEKSLQKSYALNNIGSIAADIADVIDDTTRSKVEAISAEQDLQRNKQEIREVQLEIKNRRCKK